MIVSLSPALTEVVYALKAQNLLVGVTKQCDFPQEVSEKTIVGNEDNPDLDLIEELQPELVLIYNNDALQKACETRGLHVFHAKPHNLADVFLVMENLARALHKESTTLVNHLKSKLYIVADKAGTSTTKAAFDVKPERWIIELAAKAGIILFEDAPSQSALEHFDPEHILLVKHTPEQIDWKIKAVEKGKVTFLDPSLVRPGPRIDQLIQKMGEIVRPDRFKPFGATMHDITSWYEGTEPIDPKGQYEQ